MPHLDLPSSYRRYIDCLNARDLDRLGEFVHADVEYNGNRIGLPSYRAMLQGNYHDIPDLRFQIRLLVADAATVACRLHFDCRPVGRFLDLEVAGRRVSFSENVFYQFEDGRIRTVWSLIDKAAIAEQLAHTA